MGGTKPGQIAYIGETQFAPGDWAGIVLDDPIGMIRTKEYCNRYIFDINENCKTMMPLTNTT